MVPPEQPEEEDHNPGHVSRESISQHASKATTLSGIYAPENLPVAILHIERSLPLRQTGNDSLAIHTSIGPLHMPQMPAVTLVAGFVEAVAKFLLGYRAAGRTGLYGTRDEVVVGIVLRGEANSPRSAFVLVAEGVLVELFT